MLTSRKLLQRKIYDIENNLRGSLRNFGLKVGVVGSAKFEARIHELVEGHPLVAIAAPLLEARTALLIQFVKLHRMLLDLVRADPPPDVCTRGRSDRRAYIQDMRRQSRTILKLQMCGCTLRIDAPSPKIYLIVNRVTSPGTDDKRPRDRLARRG